MLHEKIKGLHFGNFYSTHSKPENIALVYHDQTITYGDLRTTVECYASFLHESGIRAGDVVALSCYNTPEFIYGYLAITRLGAIVVPLNLTLTIDELTYILKDSSAKALCIHEKILGKLPASTEQIQALFGLQDVFVINEALSAQVRTVSRVELPEPDSKAIATLLYTSGTTGKPKGAMLSHENLMADTVACTDVLDLTSQDVFVCVLPMFHSFGFTTSVLLPLYTGASIIILEAFHPKEIIHALATRHISVFCGVPAMFVVLAQALKEGKATFPSLRVAVSGGAPLPVEILNLFNHEYSIPLMEGYGLTEASPVVCFNPLHGEKKPGSVGLPLTGMDVRITDDQGNFLETGQTGEIVVCGPNIMQGYLNLPKATAETIVDGWLHTGDIGYMDRDGYVFIVDRKKDLIITRGLNVYPREIEEVLYKHPAILEAAVIGTPDPVKGEVIKAFIVPKPDQSLDRRAVLDFLKPQLAAYKMPRFVEITDQLPKNATGKILKKELRNR